LSDSGTIAAVFARRLSDVIIIDEIAVSCRALGRGLEGTILAEVLGRIASHFEVDRVLVPFVEGPRNSPARFWVDATTALTGDGVREIANAGALAATATSLPVEMRWESDGD
jgi:predicted enzyme involved in methoxymalonyl-ACP biosynthesis